MKLEENFQDRKQYNNMKDLIYICMLAVVFLHFKEIDINV